MIAPVNRHTEASHHFKTETDQVLAAIQEEILQATEKCQALLAAFPDQRPDSLFSRRKSSSTSDLPFPLQPEYLKNKFNEFEKNFRLANYVGRYGSLKNFLPDTDYEELTAILRNEQVVEELVTYIDYILIRLATLARYKKPLADFSAKVSLSELDEIHTSAQSLRQFLEAEVDDLQLHQWMLICFGLLVYDFSDDLVNKIEALGLTLKDWRKWVRSHEYFLKLAEVVQKYYPESLAHFMLSSVPGHYKALHGNEYHTWPRLPFKVQFAPRIDFICGSAEQYFEEELREGRVHPCVDEQGNVIGICKFSSKTVIWVLEPFVAANNRLIHRHSLLFPHLAVEEVLESNRDRSVFTPDIWMQGSWFFSRGIREANFDAKNGLSLFEQQLDAYLAQRGLRR